jgi:hypothetical protein
VKVYVLPPVPPPNPYEIQLGVADGVVVGVRVGVTVGVTVLVGVTEIDGVGVGLGQGFALVHEVQLALAVPPLYITPPFQNTVAGLADAPPMV